MAFILRTSGVGASLYGYKGPEKEDRWDYCFYKENATRLEDIKEARKALVLVKDVNPKLLWEIYDEEIGVVIPEQEPKPKEKEMSQTVYLIHKHEESGEPNPKTFCWFLRDSSEEGGYYKNFISQATQFPTLEEATEVMLRACDKRAEVVKYWEIGGTVHPLWQSVITYKEAKQAQEDAKKAEEENQTSFLPETRWVIHWLRKNWSDCCFHKYEVSHAVWTDDIQHAKFYLTEEEAQAKIDGFGYVSCEALPIRTERKSSIGYVILWSPEKLYGPTITGVWLTHPNHTDVVFFTTSYAAQDTIDRGLYGPFQEFEVISITIPGREKEQEEQPLKQVEPKKPKKITVEVFKKTGEGTLEGATQQPREMQEIKEMKEEPDLEFELIDETDSSIWKDQSGNGNHATPSGVTGSVSQQPEEPKEEISFPNCKVVNLPFGIDTDDLNEEPIEAEVVHLLWCLKKYGTVKWNFRGINSKEWNKAYPQLNTLSELGHFQMYKCGLGYILTTGKYFEA